MTLSLLGWLLACDGDCATATCEAERAVRDWPTDASGVTARVLAFEDDMARVVVVARLAEAFPGQTGVLCGQLPEGESRQRCEHLNARPHLGGAPGGTGGPPPMSGGVPGPGGAAPGSPLQGTPDQGLPHDVLPVAAADVGEDICSKDVDFGACLDREARHAAFAGDAARASAACARHSTPRIADECRFTAAEDAASHRGGAAYATAAALCGVAESFRQECWAHVLTRLPRRVPPADGTSPQQAGLAGATAADIARAWADHPDARRAHVDRFWALYTSNAFRDARTVSGALLDLLPAEAAPHVRASAAMRLRQDGALRGTLAEQVATLDAALARREGTRHAKGKAPELVFVRDLPVAPPPEPSVFFLGSGRRVTSPDVATDTALVVVVSAAYAEPPDVTLLTAAEADLRPDVAAEARRLRAGLK